MNHVALCLADWVVDFTKRMLNGFSFYHLHLIWSLLTLTMDILLLGVGNVALMNSELKSGLFNCILTINCYTWGKKYLPSRWLMGFFIISLVKLCFNAPVTVTLTIFAWKHKSHCRGPWQRLSSPCTLHIRKPNTLLVI